MSSHLVLKRSVVVADHKTSISLEDEFWKSVRRIAETRGETIQQLVTDINTERNSANLSSAIRLFVLRYYQDQLNQQKDETSSARGLVSDPFERTIQ